jgi:16S rRNA processing protein RimM
MRASLVTLAENETDSEAISMEVADVAPGRPGEVRMTFHGVSALEQAQALRGHLVMVDAAQLERLPEGEYYEYELVGCRVEGEDGQRIGTVREIWSTGAADVLVVVGEAGQQHLIPTGGDFLRKVDVDERRIVIEVIPGLLDTA